MPLFLFMASLIGGIAFANEGGHQCVESEGFKSCIEKTLANGKQEFRVNE